MPDYFTHAIAAQKVYESLEKAYRQKIDNADLYLLGAQGGDLYFTYNLNYRANAGRKLHNADNLELFGALAEHNAIYAARLATHYAMDCTLHPAIYAFERISRVPFAHLRFENDLGLFVSRYFAIPRRILPRERILAQSKSVYGAICAVLDGATEKGVERCLKRHFAYTRAIFSAKRDDYVFRYDYSSLSGAVADGISLGAECVRAVFDGNISPSLFGKSFLEK